MRAADPEGEVAMHAVMPAPHLVGERLGRRGLRIGVGHLEHGRDAAHDGRAGARFEILLVVEAGLAKCTWVSRTPGRMCRPRHSISRAAEAWDRSPMAAIRPPRTPMSRSTRPS